MREYRSYNGTSNSEGRLVSGYAVRFNEESQNLGFYETISPSAITDELIRNSDVYARLNHREDAILARCRYGEGSLHLELRNDGLFYSFEAPNTELGNQLLEHIRRHEIYTSSFAFCVADEPNAQEWYKENGELKRRINKISLLTDISPTYEAAYLTTSCYARDKEEMQKELEEIKKQLEDMEKEELRELTPEEEKEINDAKNEIKTLNEEIKELEQEKTNTEEIEGKIEELEEKVDNLEEKVEEPKETSDEEQVEEVKEEKACEDKDGEERNINNNSNKSNIKFNMEKKYSLVEEIRSAMNDGHKIVLEERATGSGYTVNVDGDAVVETDYYNILAPLREKSVLAQAGAHFINGLVGDVRIPIMGKQNVTWEGETDPAKDGSASLTYVDLAPKRITGFLEISLQFLNQDSVGAENMIRQDIVNALNGKIEASILSDFSGSTTQPKGVFAEIGTPVTATTFADICAAEAAIEDNNVFGNMVYVGSNKFKAGVRCMAKGAKSTQLVYENGTIDGTPLYNTSFVDGYKAIYGDFSNLYVGTWGNVEIDVVRDSVSLKKGCVTLVINAYVDFKVVRKEAFKAITLQ